MKGNFESTIAYYEVNAREYVAKTKNIDMKAIYDRFLRYIPSGGTLLDAGSGAGRDTLVFKRLGYQVDAFDASPSLAALSTELTGVTTKVLRFQDLDLKCRYDGIWACAALLHVEVNELPNVFSHLQQALKSKGVIYVSFKEGSGERVASDGRRFTDIDENKLYKIIRPIPQLHVIEIWKTSGEPGCYAAGGWVNVLLQNSGRTCLV